MNPIIPDLVETVKLSSINVSSQIIINTNHPPQVIVNYTLQGLVKLKLINGRKKVNTTGEIYDQREKYFFLLVLFCQARSEAFPMHH